MGPLVLLANPGSKRVRLFCEAAARVGCDRPRVVAWADFLDRPGVLAEALGPGAVLRIDSPGGSHEVRVRFLARGAGEPDPGGRADRLAAGACGALAEDRGRIGWLRQEYLGMRAALGDVAAVLGARPGVAATGCPREIATMFDKPATREVLGAAGVPLPRALGVVAGLEDLRARMREAGMARVFLKPRNGSSGSGVVAYQQGRGRRLAITPTELVREGGEVRLYGVKGFRRYSEERDLADLVDTLAPEGLLAEEWVPKASVGRGAFDLRVLVVAGRARQVVVRASRNPVTNLHLGNPRGDLAEVARRWGEHRVEEARAAAERAAACFPGCFQVAVDVLVPAGARGARIAEVNAFGDLLPGALFEGKDPYEVQLADLARARA